MRLERGVALANITGTDDHDPEPVEDVHAGEAIEVMATASPAVGGQHVVAAPALPQPPRLSGTTMQDRRIFMRQHDTYLAAINALQTQWGGAFAMLVGARVKATTKRMVARYELCMAPHMVSEQQWIDYVKQVNTPSHIDYASVDKAMKKLQMKTTWPEPESGMMNLQADLEAILDQFNLTEAFEHEQRRIVIYLTDTLAPASFKAVITTKLTLHENKKYKNEVVPFCSWVTQLMRELMTWEHAAQAAAGASTRENIQRHARRGGSSGRGAKGGRGRSESLGTGSDGEGRGGRGSQHGQEDARSSHRGNLRDTFHLVRDCPSCLPGEASELLKALRERRDAARGATVCHFEVVSHDERLAEDRDVGADHGTVVARVDGVAVKAILLDSGADTSFVARGALDLVDGLRLNPVGGHEVDVHRKATFRETDYVEADNASTEMTVGRPIMKNLRYSTDKLLVEVRDTRPEWNVSEVKSEVCEDDVTPTTLQRVCRMQVAAGSEQHMMEEEADDIDRLATRTALPILRPTAIREIIMYFEKKVEVATKMGQFR
ncbi:hypothetical protein PInf_019081 [Phytophthora infestans]|nr:hypothetical protein PInf_019081 [Phytophthora infestans]